VADIFDLGDLPSWLQVPEVDTETATRVRRYANGWLMSATRLTEWPDPIPDALWAWAIELAGIAYHNPTGISREQIDDYLVQYSGERRAEILAAATAMYAGATAPRGSFPVPDWSWETVPTVDPLTI
jgi:hypothetical protein